MLNENETIDDVGYAGIVQNSSQNGSGERSSSELSDSLKSLRSMIGMSLSGTCNEIEIGFDTTTSSILAEMSELISQVEFEMSEESDAEWGSCSDP